MNEIQPKLEDFPPYIVVETEIDKEWRIAFRWPYLRNNQPIYRPMDVTYDKEKTALEDCARFCAREKERTN